MPVLVRYNGLDIRMCIVLLLSGKVVDFWDGPHVKTPLNVFFEFREIFGLDSFVHFVVNNVLIFLFFNFKPDNICLDFTARQNDLFGKEVRLSFVLPFDEIAITALHPHDNLSVLHTLIFSRNGSDFDMFCCSDFSIAFSALDIPDFVFVGDFDIQPLNRSHHLPILIIILQSVEVALDCRVHQFFFFGFYVQKAVATLIHVVEAMS